MPTSFRIDREHGVAYAETLGETSSGELLESLVALLSHPDYSPGMRLLLDMQEVMPSLLQGDILRIAEYIKSHRDELRAMKMAIVVPKASSLSVAQELEAQIAESTVDAGVFCGMPEAREWLGLASDGAPSRDDADAVSRRTAVPPEGHRRD
jgi:hypothetical protein